MLRFQGKTALVTGSGTGIGLAIAKRFAEEGASVIILGRRRGPLEEAAGMLRGIMGERQTGASVRMFPSVDVSNEAGVTGMFDALAGEGVSIDYMINNAGVSGPVRCFAGAPLDEFASTVGIHLTGTFWGSVQALRVINRGGVILTISTFFTEERPLEQRPYRFRSPYTASQGAKNRLAEAMSWELVSKGVASIATNPGPVHSDRIYKTVYPKAASEFMRVSGFGGLSPSQVSGVSGPLLDLMGEDEKTVSDGIARISADTGHDPATLAGLLDKIRTIAEKVQANTSRMIADREFLSQAQVADTVLNLCEPGTAGTLNGKVIPGDRVFYPVKPHIGASAPPVRDADFGGGAIIFTIDSRDAGDAARIDLLARHVSDRNGKVVCLLSESVPDGLRRAVSEKFHSHTMDMSDPADIARWLGTAGQKIGRVAAVAHFTGDVPEGDLTGLSRPQWDGLVERFVLAPARVSQKALDAFVPGGSEDPRLFEGAGGAIMLVGPGMPAGRTTGARRAQIEVFRGALRPFTATVNQELSDVLKSDIRLFTVLPGSVAGAASDDGRIAGVLDYMVSGQARSSAQVVFCVDEQR